MSRPSREICKACWKPSAVGFSVPDEVWEQVTGWTGLGVLCLGCFTALADERLVEWDREIEFWPVSAVSMLTAASSKEDQ